MTAQVFFTSDLHIGHARILEHSKRPFANIEEHDEALVQRWNERVKPGDRVYCLGDFALCSAERATRFARRLNGQRFLILGNHDKRIRKDADFLAQWIWARDMESIEVEGQKIVLGHYAYLTWHNQHRGAWSLHGHSHGSLRDDPHAKRLDVGVDVHGYAPISFEEVREIMDKKTFVPVDHHGARGGGY